MPQHIFNGDIVNDDNPLPTTAVNTPSENHIGEIGGNSKCVIPVLTVQATPDYSAGDVVGTGFNGSNNGILRLDNALRKIGGTGVLNSLLVMDMANQKQPLDILIFNALPTDTYTDNSPCPTISTTDVAKIIRRVSITAVDYITVGGVAIADISINKVIEATANIQHLYAVVLAATGSTINFAASSNLTLCFGIFRD